MPRCARCGGASRRARDRRRRRRSPRRCACARRARCRALAVGHAVPEPRTHGPRREASQKRPQHAVTRGARDHVMEGGVRLDELVGAVAGGVHAVELAPKAAMHVVVGAQRGQGGRLRLEHAPHLEQLEHGSARSRCVANSVGSSSSLGSRLLTYVPSPCRTSRTRASESARTASRREFRERPSCAARSASRGSRVPGPHCAGGDQLAHRLDRVAGDPAPHWRPRPAASSSMLRDPSYVCAEIGSKRAICRDQREAQARST